MTEPAAPEATPSGRAAVSKAVWGVGAHAAAAALPRFLALLLLPIYTRSLSPAEYGQIALVGTISAAIQAVASFGLETAAFREFARTRTDTAQSGKVIGTVAVLAVLTVVSASGMGIAVAAASGPLGLPAAALILASVGAGIQSAAAMLPLARLRAQQRVGTYFVVSAVGALVGAGLTVYVVTATELGAVGWFTAGVVGAIMSLACGLVALRFGGHARFSRPLAGALLLFGIPLIPHFLAHWGLSLSDRLIVGTFVDEAAVGIYGVAQQFAAPVTVLTVALNQARMPGYTAAAADPDRILQPLLSKQAVLIMAIGFATAVLAPSVILLLTPDAYAEAAPLSAWTILGATLFGLYLGPMNVLSLTAGRTRLAWTASGLAAILNVALNLWLVPLYGVTAAAVNTALGYLALLVFIHLVIARETPYRALYRWSAVLPAAGALLAAYAATVALVPTVGEVGTVVARSIIAGAAVLAVARWKVRGGQDRY